MPGVLFLTEAISKCQILKLPHLLAGTATATAAGT
jgi:hypothetical protein